MEGDVPSVPLLDLARTGLFLESFPQRPLRVRNIKELMDGQHYSSTNQKP